MFPEGEHERPETPVADDGSVAVPGTDGRWSYRPFEHDEERREHRITIVREDGADATFCLPDYLEQGDEVGDVARLVIQARERWGALKGLGG